jgi:hypothetical protein
MRANSVVLVVALLSSLTGCVAPLPKEPGSPPFAFKTEGCTLAPDFDFTACCETHDYAYWKGGSCEERRKADVALRQCIVERGHPRLAPLYYHVVRNAGSPLFPTGWRWGFGWPHGMGYSEPCE